ncbi:preprotein translocase subunit SecY [bacterium CG_4_10_14_0_2_um_filter_33_32]|nr:MAG: preprotein translocase subunit SecY [bacterium CG_4_10_14_0_8_um_filter_33_57]PIZ86576.1 MAG: preprotein translocase subunit SecY [bacterium CG_4_10_14_0_2_um_filter_33_32]
MADFIKKIWRNKELRKNLLIVLGILIVFRIMSHIPIPGVNLDALKKFFDSNEVFGLINVFSGGAMSQFSIVTLGVAPYINASIIMQLLTVVMPRLEALQKEGERGQFKINQYTRYLTVPLAIVESYGFILLLSRASGGEPIITSLSPFFLISAVITMTAGTVLLMWLGELISERGVGNGLSLIIFSGIVAQIPQSIQQIYVNYNASQLLTIIGFAFLALAIIMGIVVITEGQRKIPVTYAKRVRGLKMYGGVSTHLPIRVTQAGVIPIIFAMSLMIFPEVIAKFLSNAKTEFIANTAKTVGSLFQTGTWFFSIFYFLLVVAFTYFYTSVIFKPDQVAENIQKQGGFIPGLRPGNQTSDYLRRVVNRITLAGAVFFGVVAVLPFIMQQFTGIKSLVIGGTGLLIVVSVAIEFMKQIEAQLVMKSYENY